MAHQTGISFFYQTLFSFHGTKLYAASSVSDGQVRQLQVGIAAKKKPSRTSGTAFNLICFQIIFLCSLNQ
jgi:hypothetical protein